LGEIKGKKIINNNKQFKSLIKVYKSKFNKIQKFSEYSYRMHVPTLTHIVRSTKIIIIGGINGETQEKSTHE